MKPPYSFGLRTGLPLLVTITFTLLGSFLVWNNYQNSKTDLVDQSLRFVRHQLIFLQRELNKEASSGNIAELDQALSSRSVDTRYRVLAMVDDQGRITHASRFEKKNQLAVNALEDFDRIRFTNQLRQDRPDVSFNPERNFIYAYLPLASELETGVIRSQGGGVLFAVYDLSSDHAQLWNRVLRTSLQVLVFMLIAMVLMMVLLQLLVTRPIYSLASSARSFASGNSKKIAAIGGHGELSMLSNVFNEMTEQIGNRFARQKTIERDLRNSLQLRDEMGKMAKIGGWELDAKTLKVSWTEEAGRIHGLPPDASLSQDMAIKYYHPQDRPILKRAVRNALEKGQPYDLELRHITDDGKLQWMHSICNPVTRNGETIKLKGTLQDISRRKFAETAQKESGQRLALVVNTLPSGVLEIDLQGKITFSNKAHHRILDMEPGELIGRYFWEFWPDETGRKKSQELFTSIKKKQPEPRFMMVENFTKDGRLLNLEVQWNYQYDSEGVLTGFVAVVSDITEQKKAELKLKESEQKFSASFHGNSTAMEILDLSEGTRIDFNDSYCRLTGFTREEITDSTIFDDDMVLDKDQRKAGIEKFIADGHIRDYPLDVKTHTGEYRNWLISGDFLDYGTNDVAILTFVDITDKKTTEEELRQYEPIVSSSNDLLALIDSCLMWLSLNQSFLWCR